MARFVATMASWVIFWTTLSTSTSVITGELVTNQQLKLPVQPLSFTTIGASKASFRIIMQQLRNAMRRDDQGTSHGVPLLPDPRTPLAANERFLQLILTNGQQQTITAVFDRFNGYMYGWLAGGQFYHFSDAPQELIDNNDENQSLFYGMPRVNLNVGSDYTDLTGGAHAERRQIDLGMVALDRAITVLSGGYNFGQDNEEAFRGLLAIIMMFGEGARFNYIENRVRRSIQDNQDFRADAGMDSLMLNFGSLSEQIHNSNGGAFGNPVSLTRVSGEAWDIVGLEGNEIILQNLALMKICHPDRQLQLLVNPQQQPRIHDTDTNSQNIIRPVMAPYGYNLQFPDMRLHSPTENDETCSEDISEPTNMHIIGANGMCVDVKNGQFFDGNSLQLYGCGANAPNQLWSVKRDRTIRTGDDKYCMTSNGNAAGANVKIKECDATTTGSAFWDILDNGTISNPEYLLVISVDSGEALTELSMQENSYKVGQSWSVNNNLVPFVTTIVGLDDLCLAGHIYDEGTGGLAWLEECEAGKVEQQWALYADGTIRQHDRGFCLACPSNDEQSVVTLEGCDVRSPGHRWVFNADGAILNMYNGFLLDVKQSKPELKEIILFHKTGNDNQKWLPLP